MSETREALESMIRRQRVLADFGDFALQSEDLDAVLAEACRLVADALGTGRAKVLEIEPGGESLFVRAGVGWASNVVGRMHVPMGETSSESYSIRAGEPVITQDISKGLDWTSQCGAAQSPWSDFTNGERQSTAFPPSLGMACLSSTGFFPPSDRRPRCDDRAVLAGIIFVLRSGIPWEMLPTELGCSGTSVSAGVGLVEDRDDGLGRGARGP